MKQITRIFTVALTGAALLLSCADARAATDVVASIPELAAIAKDIGGSTSAFIPSPSRIRITTPSKRGPAMWRVCPKPI